MDNLTTYFRRSSLSCVILTAIFSANVNARSQEPADNTPPVEEQADKTEQQNYKQIEYKEQAKKYIFVDGDENGDSDGATETATRSTERTSHNTQEYEKNRHKKKHKRHKRDCNDERHVRELEKTDCRFRMSNQRDGFHWGLSAVSSVGDDLYHPDEEDRSSELHIRPAYRIQILGFFVEAPGVSTRRIHGLYASRSWGFNFYNTENWSFDLYKQRDTKVIKDLAPIQARNAHKRAGIRATGYIGNGQLQLIYSPYSTKDGDDDGIESSLSYNHYWQYRNLNLYGSIGVQYQSKEIESFYDLPSITSDQRRQRVNQSVEIGFDYPLTKNWVLGGFTSYSHLESNIKAEFLPQGTKLENSGVRSGLHLSFIF